MWALGVVVRHALDLGQHIFAVAIKRDRVYTPQHPPVRLRNIERHWADSIIAKGGRERHGYVGFARFRRTDIDGGICAHGGHYPQVGSERASTEALRSAKIRGWILAPN